MKRTFSLIALAALAASACSDTQSPTSPAPNPELSMSQAEERAGVIPGRFIVTLRDSDDPRAVASSHGVAPDFIYERALKGFAGGMSEAARSGLLRDARVVSIEPDGIMYASTTQTSATWGIDRSDQRSLPLSTTYSFTNTGAGVKAYIIDTGIRLTHSEFGGRAITGYDAVTAGGNANDCNGHGSHVAGTVGGSTYGVAKGVTLVAVRVLGCNGSGSTSGVIAGIDWVTGNHAAGTAAVANMSLGGGASTALDNAVRNSIADGVTYAVAAGNGNFLGIAQDACRYSPARVTEAVTIGASDKTDRKASFSNYGNCVDFFAPGVGITSAWKDNDTQTNTISGTSMATPHVAGVAALYLQSNPGSSPSTVRTALFNNTTKGVVTSSKSVNNHLLFTNY
ncbi:MAG TPA: S8 family serine peptidase [Gemmatimonadaceae bacterium]|nr:S8 family serine peptidase [Gemmatimonadaceae bacterium]